MGYSAQSVVWVDFVSTITGFSSSPAQTIMRYCVIGNVCHVLCRIGSATSNATTKTMTLPFASGSTAAINFNGIWHTNNGVADAACGRADLAGSSNVLTLYRDGAALAWTASGTAQWTFSIAYQI